MHNIKGVYIRQGELFQIFQIEKRVQGVSSAGRPSNSFQLTGESLKGCLADADSKEIMNWQQLQTVVTHTIVQKGKPKAKTKDRLRLKDRVFDIKGIDDCSGLGRVTLYYVEERSDISGN